MTAHVDFRRKPTVEVTALGAALIGLTGFGIYIFFNQVAPWIWANLFSGL